MTTAASFSWKKKTRYDGAAHGGGGGGGGDSGGNAADGGDSGGDANGRLFLLWVWGPCPINTRLSLCFPH